MPLQRPPVAYEYETTVGPPGPPPGPRIWPWLLALLILVLVAAGIAIGWALGRHNSNNSATTTTTTAAVTATVRVPNVVGQRADRAASALVGAGLKASFQRQLHNGPSGVVLSQQPAAASSAKSGSTVVLTISRGADTAGVPALVGLTLPKALAQLHSAGLTGKETRAYSTKPAGTVIAQVPGGGRELKKGAAVAMTVSRGAQPATVPNVIGQKQAKATATLQAAGLTAGPRQVPSSQPAGTVVAQSPAPGTRAKKGTRVQINIAQGGGTSTTKTTTVTTTTTTTTTPTTTTPARVTIPDVTGSSLADAKSTLAGVGLKADVMMVPSTQPQDTVVAQYPAAGGTAKHGGSIRLNVSKGPSG